MDLLVKPLVYARCAGSSVLCFLFLLTDSWGNLTAFFTSCSIAATPFPTLRAANFSPVTLRKIPFLGKLWHVSPAYMYPIHPCYPFLSELFSVMFHVSGQSPIELKGLNMVSKLSPSLYSRFYWEVPNQHCTLFVLQQPPRTTAEPVPWLTFTRNTNIHSGYPAKTRDMLTQQRVVLAQLPSFWDPRVETYTFTVEEFKLPSDAEMKQQDGRT